jgi:uncharacterized protein (DUF2062 family)
MGIVPIWGYQLIVGIILSKIFRLNIPIFIIAANISLPPMIPIIVYLSLYLGGIFLGLKEPIQLSLDLSLADIQVHLKQYIIGSMLLASSASLLFGGIAYLWFILLEKSR